MNIVSSINQTVQHASTQIKLYWVQLTEQQRFIHKVALGVVGVLSWAFLVYKLHRVVNKPKFSAKIKLKDPKMKTVSTIFNTTTRSNADIPSSFPSGPTVKTKDANVDSSQATPLPDKPYDKVDDSKPQTQPSDSIVKKASDSNTKNSNTASEYSLENIDFNTLFGGEEENLLPCKDEGIRWWFGEFQFDQSNSKNFSGKGRYLDDNAHTYEGYFVNGKLEGWGKKQLDLDYVLIGQFKNSFLNGKGKCKYQGNHYEGDFVNDVLCGEGKKVTSNKVVYEGTFRNFKLNGKGKITQPNGDAVEGEFVNDIKI